MERRIHPRLTGYDYSQNGAYFVTICTKDRKPILGSIAVGRDAYIAPYTNFPQGKAINEESMKKTVTIYTDGACSGNPGPGGWCAILEYGGVEKMLSGGEEQTTNNRMEMTAVIQALLALKESCIVELWSDSTYVLNALEKGWAWGWKRKGWVKSDKKPALNPDLWETLLGLTQQHEMHYHWVKGHEQNEKNNRCDKQAVLESQKFRK